MMYAVYILSPENTQPSHRRVTIEPDIRMALAALVRSLDTFYPNQWKLSRGGQFIRVDGVGGRLVLGYITEHSEDEAQV